MAAYDPKIHHRRSLRYPGFDYSAKGHYFVTFATRNLERLFGQIDKGKIVLNEFGQIAEEEWLRTAEIRQSLELDSYVIMPNHIHGIIIIKLKGDPAQGKALSRTGEPAGRPGIDPDRHLSLSDLDNIDSFGLKSGTIGAILGQYKSIVSKRINARRGTAGKQIWHRNYFERIIRDEEELKRIRKYIENNPLEWR